MEEVLDVKALLQKTEENENNIPETPSTVEVDVGNMLAFCHQEIPNNTSIKDWARDNLQELIKEIFSLPVEKSDLGPIAQLPEGTTLIPREKPFPKEKPETKWDKYRKGKGLKRRKKDTQVWDPKVGAWRYQYGHKRKNDDRNEVIIEDNEELLKSHGAEDPFILKRMQKKERVEKQKKQQRNNTLRSQNKSDKKSMPGVIGLQNKGRHEITDIKRAISLAQKSTASIGYFDKKMGDEPKIKRKPVYVSGPNEQKTNLKIVKSILRKDSKQPIQMNKAINKSITDQQNENRNKKRRLNKKN